MEAQTETNMDKSREALDQLGETAGQERHKSEMLARQLSSEAIKHWQRSIEGMLALPTAAALGVASSTMYMASLVARSFEMLQRSSEAVRAGMEQSRRELRHIRESGASGSREGGGGRMRGDANRVGAS